MTLSKLIAFNKFETELEFLCALDLDPDLLLSQFDSQINKDLKLAAPHDLPPKAAYPPGSGSSVKRTHSQSIKDHTELTFPQPAEAPHPPKKLALDTSIPPLPGAAAAAALPVASEYKSPAVQLIEAFLIIAKQKKIKSQRPINPLQQMKKKLILFGQKLPEAGRITAKSWQELFSTLGPPKPGVKDKDILLEREGHSLHFFNVNITYNSKICVLGIILLLQQGFSLEEDCEDYALLYAIRALLNTSPGTCINARKTGNGNINENRMCIQPHHYETDLEELKAELVAYHDYIPYNKKGD